LLTLFESHTQAMSVYSMTGYASAQHSLDQSTSSTQASAHASTQLGLEIRSVNSRFLDLTFRLPEELRAAEPALRELITSQLKRGKIEVRASLDQKTSQTVPLPDAKLLMQLKEVQDTVRRTLHDARLLSVSDVIRLASAPAQTPLDAANALMPLAKETLQALRQARAREGERLAAMLLDRIAQLRALAAQAVPLVPLLVEQHRQRFVERWKEAMALGEGSVAPQAAQERALTEATAFAIRIDVAEEITRLDAHLDELERLIRKGGEIGKRLDFLIQELHREANTLGSKSATLELTRISVDMKVLIEQIREQVQNIE
jgi:uncharacterized protein (TIGR00255 family)